MANSLEKFDVASQEPPAGEQLRESVLNDQESPGSVDETESAVPKLTEIPEARQLPEFLPTITEPGLSALPARQQPLFDRQWLTARKYKVEKADSPARYTDLRPEGWEENPPVLIAGGWSVGKGSLKEVARTFYEDGRRVIIADQSKYKNLLPKTTWNEKRERLKTAMANGGERLKAAAAKTKECLRTFALKVKDNAKIAFSGEQPPRPQITWDDEYLRLKTALAKGGKRVRAVLKNPLAGVKTALLDRRLRTKTLDKDLHPVIAGQAEALIDIINNNQLEKVEIVSHSTGSLPTLIAAQRQPELFSKLVLAMPAGDFHSSVKELLNAADRNSGRGLSRDALQNSRASLLMNLGSLAYVLKQPFKSRREVEAIASARVRKALADLSKKEDIKVAVLQANADPLFPPGNIESNVLTRRGDRDSRGRWRKSGEPLVNAYSSLINRHAGHDDLMIDPQNSTAAVLDILKHM